MNNYRSKLLELELTTKKEIKEFETINKKIARTFKRRMELFLQRYELLKSVDKKIENIKDPEFYTKLDAILYRERRILRWITESEGNVESKLTYALNKLKKGKDSVSAEIELIDLGHGKHLSAPKFQKFLKLMIAFLEKTEHDLSSIEKRMKIEEALIKHKTPAHFDKFLTVWKEELKSHEKLVKHYNKTLNASQQIIKLFNNSNPETSLKVLLAGFGTGISAFIYKTPELKTSVIVIALVLIAIGGIMELSDSTKTGLETVYKEKELIRKVKFAINSERTPLLTKLMD